MMQRTRWPSVYQVGIHLLLLACAFEIVLLVKQNRELKGGSGRHEPLPVLKENENVPNLKLTDLQGHEDMTLSIGGNSSLLFVFATTCPSCKENLKNWEDIFSKSPRHGIDIRAISLRDIENTRKFVKENAISFPVYCAKDTVFQHSYKIFQIPQTILVDPDGKVKRVWVGLLQQSSLLEIGGLMK